MDKTINKNFIPKKFNEQLSFSLPYTIKHEEEGHIIYQRIQERYYLNSSNIPLGYFSVLQEMTIMLFGALEMKGYVIPNTMIPDISEGRIFAKFMRDQGINIDEMPTYIHIYEDGRRCAGTKLYPNEYLFAFRQHVIEHWLPKRAIKYFKERDKTALPYINSILQLNAPDTTNKIKGK